jgi:hypothetical protein
MAAMRLKDLTPAVPGDKVDHQAFGIDRLVIKPDEKCQAYGFTRGQTSHGWTCLSIILEWPWYHLREYQIQEDGGPHPLLTL